ncbi:glycerol-3-phosphate dehydrogenase [Sphingobium phenoxybenzoativorans]|uniref:Glycerol-3-phosphate dehydrogenase n=1 Tax=Sphingobium phenoxybenzoativorans TaxID=1592790 RepID=A0A975PZK4_9SPHN|nr:glycerol-3-phosphate dehydrogenase [Sphingobium phenoxybenzoativorans]QUT03924.1 glycerol-3-phosphate dehydrogenase [Sphingobium phenoxybenzoativorans]
MTYDLIIVGGGINGCAIAREAAVNGLNVLLVEKDDLAAHTSSASTKLIHGGLRYLEYYQFKLVREALQERERLLKAAPHLIRPMHFVLPHENAIRPWWMVRLGLAFYDRIGGRISLSRSRSLKRRDDLFLAPLRRKGKGFVYSDCWVDDARLTLLNAMDAAQHGARIMTRTALVSAQRRDGVWQAELSDGQRIAARAIVNAAGPWVAEMLADIHVQSRSKVRLVKGSHIIVPRLFEGEHAYMLQQPDRRIVFAIPYQGTSTLIGTTDVPVARPEDAGISEDEALYLCAAANRYLGRQITPRDVTSSYSGVRPLYDDGAPESRAVTRDYVLELDSEGPPALSVFGGKITTARRLAQQAFDTLAGAMNWRRNASTEDRPFPGGEMANFSRYLEEVRKGWPFLGEARSLRMARAYGVMLGEMLDGVSSAEAMGRDFGSGFTEIEARWMRDREWAATADDCLMRRSKLGLAMSNAEQISFQVWWENLS